MSGAPYYTVIGVPNLSQNQIQEILIKARVIAVVGLSKDSERDSYRVGDYLKRHGYRIIPVNPNIEDVFGEKSYKSLQDIPLEILKAIDIVDIFRRSEDVPPIVDQVIMLKTKVARSYVIWMQLGIINEQSAEKAKQAGLPVIMNKCLMVEHQELTRTLYATEQK